MSHKGIRLLIQDAAKSLGDDIDFDFARTSDFNITASEKRYPYIVLDTPSAIPEYSVDGVTNYSKRWLCSMSFYGLDNEASTQEEYVQILDACDVLVDRFVNKLNFYQYSSEMNSDNILILNINQQPFIKTTSACLTGFILTFQVQVTDNFNYCGLGC